MKKDYSVYYSTSKNELDCFYSKNNNDYKIDVIDYLICINKIDQAYQKMRECYKINDLTENQINRLNFIQFLYFLSKEDEYNAKKLKRELKRTSNYNDDFLFGFYESKNFEEHIKLFDENINSTKTIKFFYKNKFHKNNIEYLYLENLNREKDIFYNKYVERNIKNHLNNILKKTKLTIFEVLHIWRILILITNHFVGLKFIHNQLFIDSELLKLCLNKLILSKENYSQMFTKQQQIDFNETIVSIYRLLGSKIGISNEKLEENQKKCIEFIQNNKKMLNQNTVFLNTLFKNEKIEINKIINEIKEILNNNIEGEIMYLVLIGTSELNPEEFLDYAEKLKSIEYNKDTVKQNNLQNLNFSIKIIEFWAGDNFNLEFLQSNMYLDPFLKLCFEYDNKKINYNQFINEMDRINYISPSMILNWNRLEKLFESTNSYEWFKKIIKKINSDELKNPRLKNYIASFYSKIINYEQSMLLNVFSEIDIYIRTIFNDVIYLYYSTIIYLNIYRNYDDNVKNIIFSIVEQFEELERVIYNKKYIIDFVYLLVSANIEIEDIELNKLLFELITGNSILKTNNILLFGICYNNKKLLIENYELIFDSILKIYVNVKNVNKNDYMLISQITHKLLTNHQYIFNIDKNRYYYESNSKYILKSDYNKKLEDLYKSLEFENIDKITDNMKEDNILYLLTHRIFFANIEKMKAGKIIKTSKNATGEELLKEMEKAIGFDKVRKNLELIRKGKIVNSTWFNVYSIHSYFKDIEQMNNNLFSNSKNELIIIDYAIMHLSSLILAVKLNLEDIIKNDNRIFITSSIYEDLMYQKTFEIQELTDGVIEPKVNYDELFDNVCELTSTMNDNNKIISISKANIMGIKNIDYVNKYDQDIFKFFVNNTGDNNKFFIIAEDPFYYKTGGFNQRSFGLYSYIIERYIKGIIDSTKLLEITEKLITFNYGFNISKNLFAMLLERADDYKIKNIVEKLKDFII